MQDLDLRLHSILNCCVLSGSVDFCKVFDAISLGANVDTPNLHNMTALMFAAQKNNLEAYEKLLHLGSQTSLRSNSYQTAFLYAAKHHSWQVFYYVLENDKTNLTYYRDELINHGQGADLVLLMNSIVEHHLLCDCIHTEKSSGTTKL